MARAKTTATAKVQRAAPDRKDEGGHPEAGCRKAGPARPCCREAGADAAGSAQGACCRARGHRPDDRRRARHRELRRRRSRGRRTGSAPGRDARSHLRGAPLAKLPHCSGADARAARARGYRYQSGRRTQSRLARRRLSLPQPDAASYLRAAEVPAAGRTARCRPGSRKPARRWSSLRGRDAAGKGGTIKRFMEHLNPRGARVVALEKPTEVERGQWYFQRYVQHLPTNGEIVLLDRSGTTAPASSASWASATTTNTPSSCARCPSSNACWRARACI